MNFEMIWMPKAILTKKCRKKSAQVEVEPFLY